MESLNLAAVTVIRKQGSEQFFTRDISLGFKLLEFWQWYASDLASNALRGVLAEFLVANALGVARGTRIEWDAYDLQTDYGATVEVKSAAYLQSWSQSKMSDIVFGIQPRIGWNASTNTYGVERKRQADVYVFALLKHQDKATLDPLNLDQWEFWVVPTSLLDNVLPTQKALRLATLRQLCPQPGGFAQLATAVHDAFIQSRRERAPER
jgi:hypothetical protein